MATVEIREVERYIRTHIGEIRGVQDVAKHFGVTADALSMQWKRSGKLVPLGRYLDHERLLAIRAQIMNGALCFEAASAAGFQNRSTAFRAFERFTGLSLRQYRRMASALATTKSLLVLMMLENATFFSLTLPDGLSTMGV